MGLYSKTSLGDMYNSVLRDYDSEHRDIAWAEAENIMEIRELMCDWFVAMEAGTANKRFLDPRGPAVSLEEAEKMIAEIDDDFSLEKGRWISLGVEAGPDYFRLEPHAKIAFVQQILMTIKTIAQLNEEVHKRQKAGEQVPPEPFAPKQPSPPPHLGYTPANDAWDFSG